MICRHCESAYERDEKRCGSCGAAKASPVETLLDVRSSTAAWSPSYLVQIRYAVLITLGIAAVNLAIWQVPGRAGGPFAMVNLAWALFVVPIMLGAASLAGVRDRWPAIGLNLALALPLWGAIVAALVISVAL